MLAKGLSILLMFLKNEIFISLIFNSFLNLNLIDLGPDLYYFSPSASVRIFFLIFLEAQGALSGCLFEMSLFFNVGTCNYKLSPYDSLCFVPQILVGCILIFIRF
jgi:hypothetical protein